MITAGSSGGAGDIVFSIPVMRSLGVQRLYVKENWYKPPHYSLYDSVKRLIEHEGIECVPTRGGYEPMVYEPGLKLDYDLDRLRLQPGRGRVHIVQNLLRAFGQPENDWQSPWLMDFRLYESHISLIHLTPRWRDNSKVDWERVLMTIEGDVFFIGFPQEHKDFCKKYGFIPFLRCEDLYQMGRFIASCKALYCNQSVALAIAQGMGKTYYLEPKPGKTNCLMYTPNENILR